MFVGIGGIAEGRFDAGDGSHDRLPIAPICGRFVRSLRAACGYECECRIGPKSGNSWGESRRIRVKWSAHDPASGVESVRPGRPLITQSGPTGLCG
jgi:hypothetical protein